MYNTLIKLNNQFYLTDNKELSPNLNPNTQLIDILNPQELLKYNPENIIFSEREIIASTNNIGKNLIIPNNIFYPNYQDLNIKNFLQNNNLFDIGDINTIKSKLIHFLNLSPNINNNINLFFSWLDVWTQSNTWECTIQTNSNDEIVITAINP